MVTLGKDEQGATKIKLWNTEGSVQGPALLRTIDCFVGKHTEAVVTELAVHDSQPQLIYALGLSTGYVLVLRADTGILTPCNYPPPIFIVTMHISVAPCTYHGGINLIHANDPPVTSSS